MRRGAIVLLMAAAIVLPCFGSKRVSVAQFQQMLSALNGKPDAEAAFYIADVELTERMSATRLERLRASVQGERSREALTAIADASQFQPPPPEEMPATAAPDLTSQRRIMSMVANYVSKTVPKLPDFTATRVTSFFEDTPLLIQPGGSIPYQPLHRVGGSSATVMFRDGREVEERQANLAKKSPARQGLQSWGEFGPMLATILVDAAQNKLAFSRWEQGAAGLRAIFSYEVPREKSHYDINYCCVANEDATRVANMSPFRQIVGYHGEMGVDPETGVILRLSVIAALKPGSPVKRADMLVDYGPVEIGGKTYISPINSVSVTTAETVQLSPGGIPLARQLQPLKTMLNDVTFEQYHMFRSESRVLTAQAEPAPAEPSPDAQPSTAGSQAGGTVAAGNPELPLTAKVESPTGTESHSATEPPPNAPMPDLGSTGKAHAPDNSTAIPPSPAQTSEPAEFTLRQDVRNVVIDVAATDKHGEPIHALDKTRFRILENGVPQDISFFEEHTTGGTEPAEAIHPSLPANVHTNVSSVPAAGALMVILLDALNTRSAQQSYLRGQVLEYLKQIPAGTTLAIFTLADDLKMIQGFTSDPAILRAALDGKAYPTPILNSLDGRVSAGSPDRTGGGPISFSYSVAAVRSSLDHFSNGPQDFDNELRIRLTLDALNALGVYLAGIPGRKNLVWFTGSVPWTINPDFSLVTNPTGRVDYSEELKKLADVLTVGRISVYPVDATALDTPGGYGSDRANPNFAVRGNGGAFGREEMNSQMELAGSHMSMANLAAATGGFAMYNTNGLAGAVARVQSVGGNYYTLAYSPRDKRYDGSFRKIEVQAGDPGVKLEYRRGYYAQDPTESAKRSLATSANPLQAAMKRGAPEATQIPFRIETSLSPGQPDPHNPSDRLGEKATSLSGPTVRYDFHWSVDLRSVAFSTTADGHHRAELDATVYAFTPDGQILNNIYSVLPLNLDDATYARVMQSALTMKQTLDVPAGLVYVRVGVLDPATAHTGAVEFPMTIQVEPAGAATSK